MESIEEKYESAKTYLSTFLKWIFLGGITGSAGGLIGTLFHVSVEKVTEYRLENNWVLYFLPIGGIIIAFLYKSFKMSDSTGTNQIIDSIRSDQQVPVRLAPLIFISTVITHLFGGSAGRAHL